MDLDVVIKSLLSVKAGEKTRLESKEEKDTERVTVGRRMKMDREEEPVVLEHRVGRHEMLPPATPYVIPY